MLTDLRHELKGVGRLDVMNAVNERALHYYADQDLTKLPPESLERRARILHAMGEDDETRGDDRAAVAKFREAERTTAALLAEIPDDPDRIFYHAQSEFYLGLHEYDQGRFAAANKAFLAYKALADRLVSIAPTNPKYRQEVGFADSNLCSVAEQRTPTDGRGAILYCTDALVETEWAAHRSGATREAVNNLVERHAWLADAYFAAGDFPRAKSERLAQERLLNGLMKADPKNRDLKDTWIILQRALAYIERGQGHDDAARTLLEKALAAADEMIRFDDKNDEWRKSRTQIQRDLENLRSTGKGTPDEKQN